MSSSPITTNATKYTTALFLFLEKSYYYLYGKPQQAQKNYDCYEVCCVKFQIDSHLNAYYTFDAANEVLFAVALLGSFLNNKYNTPARSTNATTVQKLKATSPMQSPTIW